MTCIFHFHYSLFTKYEDDDDDDHGSFRSSDDSDGDDNDDDNDELDDDRELDDLVLKAALIELGPEAGFLKLDGTTISAVDDSE